MNYAPIPKDLRPNLDPCYITSTTLAQVSKIQSIAYRLGISGETTEGKDPAFIPGRCAQIKTKDITLTYGEIHPSALEKFELGYPAIGGEIHW